MYAEITAAIASTKALAELLKAARQLSNYNELVAAVSEVNAKLMAATNVALASQEKQAALVERVRELEQQVAKAEDWECQTKRYTLVEFQTGALAYALNPSAANEELAHHVCAACFDQHHISKLQPRGNRRFLFCHHCKLQVQIEPVPPPQPRRISSPYL